MEEMINFIINNGGIVVLAILFLYIFFEDRKKAEKREQDSHEEKQNNNAILKELSNSNRNIAESLSLLRLSIDTNTNEFKAHDERAIKEFNNINEKLIRIEEKVKKE